MKHALHDVVAEQVMLTDFQTLSPADPLSRAVELTLAGSQKDFPVTADGRVVGVLSQNNLLAGLQQGGSHLQVGEAMQTQFEAVQASARMEQVFDLIQHQPGGLIIVSSQERTVGIINLDNLLELLRIQQAINRPA
jgi:predicted transcriptional regulator